MPSTNPLNKPRRGGTSRWWRRGLGAAAAWLPLAAGAQFLEQPPLVIVDISAVVQRLADNTQVDASQIPLTLQVPADIAREVCGGPAYLAANQGVRVGTCTARNTTAALERAVREQVLRNE